mmetsp:Transcript_57454/g.151281  ORF Transcript_57454/g.151281 Transcript_57454/m.151281 type:complete len:170 (+) Transcript_57454:77-586(+)
MDEKRTPNHARLLRLIVQDAQVGDAADESLLPDEMRSKYRAGNILGKGAFGCVFRATKSVVARPVAFKIVLPSKNGEFSSKEERRLIREAKILQNLKCEHAVEIIDADFSASKDRFYLIMEVLEGSDLAKYIKTHGPIDSHEAITMGMSILEVLIELRSMGVAHRKNGD